MAKDGDYRRLLESEEGFSGARRLAVVLSAVLACMLNSGLAFGFSALLPVLIADGAFHDNCPGSDPVAQVCRRQYAELTGMFTLATSLLNVMSMPSGALLDRAGPKVTATGFALVVAVGCGTFAFGGAGPSGHLAYYLGFLLLAVSGPAVFNCTLSFGNLFPGREGLVTAALVGCFDASSAVFVGLADVIESGVTFREAFLGYAALPLATAVTALLLWPRRAVLAPGHRAHEDEKHAEDGRPGTLAKAGLRKQVASAEFGLLGLTVSVTMVCINFFIATAYAQMAEVDSDTALRLTKVFAIILPLGGFAYIPLIGAIIDLIGPTKGFVVLWAAYVCFQGLLAAYRATGCAAVAYLAFTVFSFCRPLFYTLGASFCGQTFGFVTFGKVYGLVTTIAGFMNLSVQPLGLLAADVGFARANALVLAAQLTTAALPAVVLCRARRRPGRRLDEERRWTSPEGLLEPCMDRARSISRPE